ncbi:uncharacterized protein DUF5050 [Mobilisporobacter senegalensis]|uniref:Uncharacterized protein DUF5050 n=1 Tax=Mobilisporobacter senegalensis TaxID=1329262 RepID=A0A3N1XPQ5_9FIRM|nr:DUF5050 domain-containing protein [Mobilisporobacter senegalensis]ROR28151.1 uncharacterized protein DUF5050 [Mobilisporobacter senegalensis]
MKFKRIGLIFIIIAVVVFIFINMRNQSEVTLNEENVQGNTGGNLLNGGLFCELDDKIYFSNIKDDGSLYSMDLNATNFEKVYEDKVKYINGAGKYIYYTKRSSDKEKSSALELDNKGIYRIDRDGSNIKRLYAGLNENMKLYGNYIYFEHSTKDGGLTLYKIKIDGTEEQELVNEPVSPTSIMDGIIYYSGIGRDHNIHTYDINTSENSTLYQENTMNAIAANDYIYYMSLSDNYSIHRIKKDGTNPETVVKDRCAAFNISSDGNYLYYQVDDGENNGIYRFDTETNGVESIISGNYNNINITSNFVFFQEFRSDNIFYLPVGEKETLSTFNPPVLKK